jgi:hypothetical protein
MNLTFTQINGKHRADGETFSYVIVRSGKDWEVSVYLQNRLYLESDKTTIVTLDREVRRNTDDLLRDVKAWAQAFDSSAAPEHDYGQRATDATTRSYRELGYTR